MQFSKALSAGIVTTMSALALCIMLAPSPSEAATCGLFNGKWKCGATSLAAAKSACDVTTGGGNHSCDSGINVCTCATGATRGAPTDLKIVEDGQTIPMSKDPRREPQ